MVVHLVRKNNEHGYRLRKSVIEKVKQVSDHGFLVPLDFSFDKHRDIIIS